MKRRAAAALLILFSVTLALSVRAEETQRYLVGTRRAFRAGGLRAAVESAPGEVRIRNLAAWDIFDGFAADLTAEDVARLRRSPEVRWVEPLVERHALELRNYYGQTTPYGVNLVNAQQAWSGVRSGEVNVVVADTGVDYRHPDIAPLWAGGQNLMPGLGIDPVDENGHGTHVAGIVAASNNQFGVVGVAGVSGIRLWGLRVLNAKGSGWSETVLASLDWVVKKKKALGGQWIINYSLGGTTQSLSEANAMKSAAAAGVIIVAATGNESSATAVAPVVYPAAYPEAIAVGAVDSNSSIAEFSNQGPEVDVVAPGVGILSTLPRGTGAASFVTAGTTIYDAPVVIGAKMGIVTAELVDCGLGNPQEIPVSVAGKIALIKRGDLRFAEKARNAKQAGAAAVLIYNHDTSAISWTLLSDEAGWTWTNTYEWPVTLGISKADGEALLARGGTVTLSYVVDDYGELNGTSMATPYVSGAAALLWAMAPSASPETVRAALTGTARDLGTSGQDPVFGFGLIDVNAAARQIAPSAFEPVTEPVHPKTGRRILRRGRH